MTTIETAGADVRAVAVTKGAGRAARPMIVTADDLRVLETLVDGCMGEEEAGAARTTGTDRGLGESPEPDLDHSPNLRLREKTSTRRPLPITPRKKCGGHTPHPAPGPSLHQGHAPIHVLGLDPGLDASPEDARQVSAPPPLSIITSDGPELVICPEKMFVLT